MAERELIVMRLKDMHVRHSGQDNSRFCSRCPERVGIYPSGQAVLKARPETVIVCQVCWDGTPAGPAPGALGEVGQGQAHG